MLKKSFFICCALILPAILTASSITIPIENSNKLSLDSITRISELDQFWKQLAKTVEVGDFQKYLDKYHPDAVVIFEYKSTLPIKNAMELWKQGFIDTKSGKIKSEVEFKFTKRIGNQTTAFEKGMYKFSTKDDEDKIQEIYVHFEALLIKKNGVWKCTMENQKTIGSEEEWEEIKNFNRI